MRLEKAVGTAPARLFDTELAAQLRDIERRQSNIEAMVKKLALGVLQLNNSIALQANGESLEDYDFVFLQSAGKSRWVWKHFMRGSRSARAFDTREEAVADARRDAVLHINQQRMLKSA